MSQNSEVWQFFQLNSADPSKAKCTLCKASISRGRKGAAASSFTTSNMRKHLKNVHGEMLQTPQRNQKQTVADDNNKETIKKSFDKQNAWSFNDDRSRKVNQLIGEMIARDDQPFNIVNNLGKFKHLCYFQSLLKYCTRQCLDGMFALLCPSSQLRFIGYNTANNATALWPWPYAVYKTRMNVKPADWLAVYAPPAPWLTSIQYSRLDHYQAAIDDHCWMGRDNVGGLSIKHVF